MDLIKKNFKNKNLVFAFFVYMLYFVLDEYSQIYFPFYTYPILTLVLFIMLEFENRILIYFYLIPLSSGNNLYVLNVIFSMFFFYELVLKKQKFILSIIKNKRFMFVMFIVFLEGVHFILNQNDSIIKFLGFGLIMIMVFFLFEYIIYKQLQRRAIFFWSLGIIFLMLNIWYRYVSYYGLLGYMFKKKSRFGYLPKSIMKKTSFIYNPNLLARWNLVTLLLMIDISKQKYSTLQLLSILLLFVSGLYSGSRSFWLSMFVIIIYFSYLLRIKNHIRKSFWRTKLDAFIENKILLSFVGTLIIVVALMMVSVVRRSLLRGFTGNRLVIYLSYLKRLGKFPTYLFGVGLQDYPIKLGQNISAHNFLLEIISAWGLIGLLIIIFIVFLEYQRAKKSSIIDEKEVISVLVSLSPIISLLIFLLTEGFFISYYHTLPFLALIISNIYDKETNF